jgi:chemosensory pili system protein ChpB (putative protein-glutamate methylesterase)
MADPATRVALLARPGAACDNLQAALQQLGAEVVAVQDPGDGDPAAIAAARPAAVLVALEPALEEALERYDAVLSEPGRLVIYDEVAVAARREGWDAARWARHLAAKLGGHADVLPPGAGAGDDDAHLVAPRPRAAQVVSVPAPEPPPAPAESPAMIEFEAEVEASPDAFDADSIHLGLEPESGDALANAGEGIDFGGFTPEMMAAMAMEPMSAMDAPAADEARPAPPAPEEVDGNSGDAGVAAMVAPSPSPVVPAAHDAGDPNILEWDAPAIPSPPEPAPEMPAAAASTPTPSATRFSADDMTLVDMESDSGAGLAAPAPPAPARAAPAAPVGSDGAVVVLAGIGGPDAVRQFLAALPGGFARPIVVRQRLDGGRHDRLVRQMQRATSLPVELAEAGRPLVAGHVYILPDGMTTTGDDGAAFLTTDAPVPVLAGLPAARSAVLVLSGSDPASVPEMLEAARAGALVAGQSPEDSFDGAAAAALVAAGGDACTAAELAQRISARWNS